MNDALNMMFSVVIVTHNRAALLARTLDSLWRQTSDDFEVIVVDDGSTDGTLDYLKTLEGRVRVFAQPNKGPSAARNLGANHSRGDYIAFLDSDDLWFPWTLATFAEVIIRYGKPALIAASALEFNQETELDHLQQGPVQVECFADYLQAGRKPYFVGAGMMVVRKEVFDASHGFADRRFYLEDSDLALRLGQTRFVQILAPVTLGYRRTPDSARRDARLNFEGAEHLIQSEKRGRYPGGTLRRLDRLWLITLHTRSISIDNLRRRRQRYGWRLYWETFAWQARLRRWKYLLGFPMFALACAMGLAGLRRSGLREGK